MSLYLLFMKKLQTLVVLLLTTSVFSQIQLFSASTFLGTDSPSLSGSLLGGRTIYIKGVGFPTDPTQVQVMIGNYPCKVPADGITPTTLSCVTTPTGGITDIYNLQIKVICFFEVYILKGFTFSYLYSDTPELTDIYPSASVGNRMLNYIGRHRVLDKGDGVRNMGDFIGLYVSNQLCGMFDILQEQISYNGISRAKCIQAREQEAGKYNVSEHVVAGWAYKQWWLRKPSLSNQYYQHTVLPAITEISPNSGAESGQDIIIKGSGFSKDKSKIQVLVDGLNCPITSSSLTEIACRLSAKQNGVNSSLSTSVSTPTKNYLSGTGFSYERYDLTNLLTRNLNGFKSAVATGSPQISLIESGYSAELQSQNVYGSSSYGQVYKGYFYAPVSGNYIFRGACDDAFSLMISNDYGTTGSTLVEEIYETQVAYSDENYYISNHSTALGRERLLEGGKYYYMQAYHINWGGPGFFKVSVQVPNSNPLLIKKRYEVNQISTSFTNDPQIMSFTLEGATGGTFNLSIIRKDPVTLQVIYSKQVEINYNAGILQFQNALNQFDSYNIYGTTCTNVKIYDINDVEVTSNSGPGVKFVWTVSIDKLRDTAYLNEKFAFKLNNIIPVAGFTPRFTQLRVKSHCPLIDGTFTMNIGATPIKVYDSVTRSYSNINIPANVTASTLAAAIRQFSGFDKVDVFRTGVPGYGATWIISYIQYTGNVPDITLSASKLTGGKAGTFPEINFFETRTYSSNLIFNPIDENFMFMPSPKGNVIVKVNQIKSVCLTNCQYTFLPNTPIVTNQSLSNSILSVSISNPLNFNYPTSMLIVKLDGKVCSNIIGTFTSFTCQLPTNSDSSPILRAGYHNVQVFLMEIGLLTLQPGLAKIYYPLVINSVVSSSGGKNGGYQILLTGKGFPLASQTQVITLCGKKVQITAISNTETKIIVPQCSNTGQQEISYIYNNLTANTMFDYTLPQIPTNILSIYPHSASPVLKAVMTITGTGFGNNISAATVYLANSTGRIYQMRVLSLNDSVITCGIPGGLPGKFDVRLSIQGKGDIIPTDPLVDDFTYELVIENVTPSAVSYYGGTLIKIKGRNFSPDKLQNLVHVGNQLNWLCSIQFLNKTDIHCRVPPKHSDWTSLTQQIVLNNRLIQDSICENSCAITYSDLSLSPALNSISTTQTVSGSGSITLFGTNLNIVSSSGVTVVLQNKITNLLTIINPTLVQATQIRFDVPSVQAGFYSVRVRLDPIGQTNSYSINLKSSITSTSPSGSIKGSKLIIQGQGLPSEWPSKLFSIKIQTNSYALNPIVKQTNPTLLILQISEGFVNQSYSLTFSNPLQQQLSFVFSQVQSSTPRVSILSNSFSSPGLKSIQLNRTNLPTINLIAETILLYNPLNPSITTNISSWTQSGTTVSFSYDLKAGSYGVKIYYKNYGWGDVSNTISVASAQYTSTLTNSSLFGGKLIVTGSNINPESIIKVGGFIGKILNLTPTQATFEIPPLTTQNTLQTYPQVGKVQKIKPAALISDNSSNQGFSFDSVHSTFYWSSNSVCYVGIDAGENRFINVSRIRYFPYYKWNIAARYIKGGLFQGSNDGNLYTTIGQVDQTVHAGWNSFLVNSPVNYRFIRFKHSSVSGCKLSQFEVYGILLNNLPNTNTNSFTTDAVFFDGFNTYTFSQIINYNLLATPIVKKVEPSTGSIYGNQIIKLTGQNLNFGTGKILIDEIQCIINQTLSTLTNLYCKTQPRLNLPEKNTFLLQVAGNKALIEQQFIYTMRWSDIRTWGTDLPPVQGDLVYVPKGMSLFVDESTPRLDGIVVENGKLIFSDEKDMQIHTNLITINRGQFIAGTQKKPYQKKLTFIMYGSYYGKQQPMFGNKGIGCMQCKFSMYGTPRLKTWTLLNQTINVGSNWLIVQDNVDWAVNQQIVIASTNFDHNEAEQRTITSISGRNITVNAPFKFKHLGVVQNYGTSDRLQIKAEVGLLSRNIKMRGDPTSEEGQYGSHLMLAGSAQKGLIGHVAYTQFTHCGQPRIVGRYCIHFHMNGDVSNSFVKGNAVHHSFARILTLHGIQYLKASENVGYRVKGHNFFIQDGIQTQNVIQNNLVIGSLQSWNMMQTDISVASFWITNPSNHLRNNRAAGGDFYGFWYQIKTHPDGPSATQDVCPIGNPLGQSHDNVAHSYKRFGLRIFKLYSRERPCDPIRDDSLADPWQLNPSVQSTFYNYLTYKNGEDGLLAEQVGNVIFQNFTIADSKRAGMEFYKTNFTKELVEARNFAIIGLSRNNAGSVSQMNKSAGVIAPRSSGWKMSHIRFYNFESYMNIFQTCSNCDNDLLFTNTAHQYLVSNVEYSNVSGSYLKLAGLKREIIYDLDGSFSQPFNSMSRTSATLVYSFKHLVQELACTAASQPNLWDNALVCDETIKIRKIMFTNLRNQFLFKSAPIKVQLITDVFQVVPDNSTQFTQVYSIGSSQMQPMEDHKKSYSLAFVAGRTYNIWWLTGLDFTHLNIDVSKFFQDADPAIIFKFNYTQNRQFYQVGHLINGEVTNITTPTVNNTLDESICQFGDYTHDVDNRTFTVCATSRGKLRKFQYMDIVGIKCRYLCPSDTGQYIKQNFIRLWSNFTQWPSGRIPLQGQNVTIPGEWTVLVDIQPNTMNFWKILGDVIIPDSNLNVTLRASNIWIMAGSIKAGTSSSPYLGNLTIQIIGSKNDRGIVIDPTIAGNKMFVVTGKLQLYGITPATSWSKLIQIARPGDNSIKVTSALGWNIGDEITLSPSFSSPEQYQKVTITKIVGNYIQFFPVLRFKHYGSPQATITNQIGTLDTRAAVGHLTRNIKIRPGPDSGWGFHLLIYGFLDDTILRTGNAVLSGVQLIEGGQYDTQNSALKLLNTVSAKQVKIYKSSFHNCKSFCLDVQNINNANIKENVFYQGRLFLVRANQLRNYVFEKNLMVAATKRPTLNILELVACYATYDQIHTTASSIRYNLCQGSDLHGFILPYIPCSLISTPPYQDNTVGSAQVGYVFNKIPETCLAGSGAKSYACKIGHIASSPNTYTIIFQKFMIADSKRGLTLRFGKQHDDSTAYLRNSYVSAISRPECTQCYGNGAISCTSGTGVRMLAVTINGQSLPGIFGKDFDVICRQETFDSKAFLNNVIFENFRITYQNLPQCSNNSVFEPHKLATDMTGSHHLHNTVCNNCQINALARFTPPLVQHLGWFGGCGKIFCTGKNNYLIQDHTGDFLGQKGFLLANNSEIGDKTEGCTFFNIMNGHFCKRLDFSVIQYESIAPDFNTRIMWPVYLKFDGGNWNSTTNGWRQWQWDGNQPLNKRLARFVSVVQVNQVYNMTFQSEPPIDMRFQFQRRTQNGNNSQWIVIKLHYPRPNSIRVQVGGNVIKPISLLDNNGQSPLSVTKCGSNKFFYQNYTIHFVLNAELGCQVRVSLTNSIQLTARFAMDINEFFNNDGQTKFIDRMCAVLGIVDTSRLKIVGIYTGSVVIHAFIDEERKTNVQNATLNDNDLQKSQIQKLKQLLTLHYQNGTLNQQFLRVGLGSLIDIQSSAYFHKYDNQIPYEQQLATLNELKTSLAIGLSLGFISLVSIIIVGLIYIKKKSIEVENIEMNQSNVKIEETLYEMREK